MGPGIDYGTPCGYYAGHERTVREDRDAFFRQRNTARIERDEARRQRDSYKERMEAAQLAVSTLGVGLDKIEAKVRELEEQQAANTALNEAALFVGKNVLVYPKDGPNPVMLGKVKHVEVLPSVIKDQINISVVVTPKSGPNSHHYGEPVPYVFTSWRFEEVG